MKTTVPRILVLLVLLLLPVLPAHAESFDDDVITVITDGSGDATVFSRVMRGRVAYVHYKGGLDATADFTITVNRTGTGLWTETNVPDAIKTVRPSVLLQLQDGTDHTVRGWVFAVGSSIKFVIAQGGATKTATFEIVVF